MRRALAVAMLTIMFPLFLSASGVQTVTVGGVQVLWDGYRAIEPDSHLDIDSMELSDFGEFFTEIHPVEVSSYTLMEGELTQTTVYHIHGRTTGKVVYVVGAVHGDERAAWYAASLLRNASIAAGDLYVLVPANANGARNLSRYVAGGQDLNRSFPGDAKGNEAQRLANAIFKDIGLKKPDLVLDLHEAIVMTPGRDFLGSTYIFTSMDGMEDLIFDLMLATENGTICHNAFSITGPGPLGSINATVTKNLGISTLTIETFRGFDIYRRVHDQLDTIQFILDYLEMI